MLVAIAAPYAPKLIIRIMFKIILIILPKIIYMLWYKGILFIINTCSNTEDVEKTSNPIEII